MGIACWPCSLQFRGQITGSSVCPAHFQRENGHFVRVNLRDAVGSSALSCSWENDVKFGGDTY